MEDLSEGELQAIEMARARKQEELSMAELGGEVIHELTNPRGKKIVKLIRAMALIAGQIELEEGKAYEGYK